MKEEKLVARFIDKWSIVKEERGYRLCPPITVPYYPYGTFDAAFEAYERLRNKHD